MPGIINFSLLVFFIFRYSITQKYSGLYLKVYEYPERYLKRLLSSCVVSTYESR